MSRWNFVLGVAMSRKMLCVLAVPLLPLNAQLIPEATKVKVRLEQSLSSATAEVGQSVQLTVSDDVRINDIVVIPRNAVVNGTVVEAVPKRRMGRTGKLDFSIDEIVLPGGDAIPVRYSVVKKEGGSKAVSTGVITAGVAVVFWPAAPFVLLRKGNDTTFNKGMTFEVFTDAAYTGRPARSIADPNLAVEDTTHQVAAPAKLSITSKPPGAEITLDGKYYGDARNSVETRDPWHSSPYAVFALDASAFLVP